MTPELYARIRRLFFGEHWKVGTIAKELGIHHDTVRGVLETERMCPRPSPTRPSILDPYKSFILDTLAQHPTLRASRIYDMIRTRGYVGSAVQVRRYVRTVRPARSHEPFIVRQTLPGEEAQVDWGHFGKITVGHAQRALSCFVMVLGHSRAMHARFTLDQTLESFIRGHVASFERFGGVPRKVLYDNLKSVVIERQGEHVRFHETILELAGHYHFAPTPCAPYRANEKGKVERTIQYIRHAFFAARPVTSIEALNAELLDWIDRVAHARPCPRDPARRIVQDVWLEEKATLLPLPENRFESDLVRPARSGKTPYIRFDKNDYSIPADWVRKPLTLIASESEVRITCDVEEGIARHQRSYDRGATVEDPKHIEALVDVKRRARDLRGRDRLAVLCPSSPPFLEQLALRDASLRHETALLNRLVDRYDASRVDAAIREALQREAISAASVAHILDLQQRNSGQPPVIEPVASQDPRVRDLRIQPHDLRLYDGLGKRKPDDEEEPS